VDARVGNWHHIWICFDPRPHWKEWLKHPALGTGITLFQLQLKSQREQVHLALQEAVRFSKSVRPNRRSLVLNRMEQALIYCDEWNPAGNAASKDERIQAVLEYINEHAFEKLSIDLLARVCSLSPSRFSHLFQEEMGQAPMQYIEERRLDRARELLMTTTRPISLIAEECGFSNGFYFSRVFKARTGMAPRDARAEYIREKAGTRSR
jgi:AraC family transcriptional regulator of arabinose operon